MTPIDDLKPGMWIAVTKLAQPDSGGIEDLPYFSRQRPVTYGGQPLEVLAISLPFVSVCDGRQVFAIDVRETQVKKLDRRYVQAMTKALPDVIRETQKKRSRRRKKEKPDASLCPRCRHSLMVQRLIVKPTGNHWEAVCPECGASGGPVPK